ncbi:flagellar hook-basal body complex protein [Candidatus Sarmatiella mevalonica]|uniref:flagellar hook-basal body complex protein n=1 Tax=Candidatus Sarmatiella mevalonica TaxID=2770581 RepID=UPI001922F65E|nr:flagellar hook-basal body complex protein [Candidatus Sarmatiella mevalonica]
MARKITSEMVTNNLANAHTIGYRENAPIIRPISTKHRKTSNHFVRVTESYQPKMTTQYKNTKNRLNLAISGPGYFKVLTSQGPRYTLNGEFLINSDYFMVNKNGFFLLNSGNQPISLPNNASITLIDISSDGSVYYDGTRIDIIGVFDFPEEAKLLREGNNLYAEDSGLEFAVANPTIMANSLLISDVSTIHSMELMQQSHNMVLLSEQLVNNLNSMEKSTVDKLISAR